MNNKISFSLIPLLFLLTSCKYLNGPRPEDLGISIRDNNGRKVFALKPCPDKANCVSSYEFQNGKKNYLEPISYDSEPIERAYDKILKIGLEYKKEKVRLVSKNDKYIHFEFTSKLLSITDDVEFFFGEHGKIHFRSASRKIPYDLSANKKRIEDIRFRFFQNDF